MLRIFKFVTSFALVSGQYQYTNIDLENPHSLAKETKKLENIDSNDLLNAANNGDAAQVRFLLSSNTGDFNKKVMAASTALQSATHDEVIKVLFEFFVDRDKISDNERIIIVKDYINLISATMLSRLIKAIENPNKAMPHVSPVSSLLLWAAEKGHDNVVKLLLSHPKIEVNQERLLKYEGININKETEQGSTALHIYKLIVDNEEQTTAFINKHHINWYMGEKNRKLQSRNEELLNTAIVVAIAVAFGLFAFYQLQVTELEEDEPAQINDKQSTIENLQSIMGEINADQQKLQSTIENLQSWIGELDAEQQKSEDEIEKQKNQINKLGAENASLTRIRDELKEQVALYAAIKQSARVADTTAEESLKAGLLRNG